MSPLPPDLIYVVDDDDDVRYSIKLLLERAGYIVRDFSNAESFQAVTDGRDASCLLLDVNLSGITGLDLLQRLRALGVQVPIIVLSGNSSPFESQLAAANVFHVLDKPTPAQDLLSWVSKACASARRISKGSI